MEIRDEKRYEEWCYAVMITFEWSVHEIRSTPTGAIVEYVGNDAKMFAKIWLLHFQYVGSDTLRKDIDIDYDWDGNREDSME